MPKPAGRGTPRRRFPTTRWSLVLAAGRTDGTESRHAVASLCREYWDPLYAFSRCSPHDPEEARDLVQGFFQHFLSKNYFANLRPEKGRFRSYLLKAFQRHEARERKR